MDTRQDNEQVLRAWLQHYAIPIDHIEAGNGFADLQPLKPILQNVTIVGLGEATHGTREFFQLKHRLVEFLVTELQFTAFALEASYAACQPINDYILYGTGDRAAVVTEQGYVAWDTEEFSDMVDWLRTYNQGVPDAKKVTFHGVDVTNNARGRHAILDYLHRLAPDLVPATEVVFQEIANEEAKWPMRIDDASKARLRDVLPRVHDLITHLSENEDTLVRRSSVAEFEQISRYAHVMQQWLLFEVGDGDRSRYMAENLKYVIERERPGAKWVVWEHNSHISVTSVWGGAPNMGQDLRAWYGDGYFAVGLEFNQGAYQARTVLPDNIMGDLTVVTLPPAPVGSLPWYVSRTDMGNVLVNLRTPPGDPVVEQWLTTPQRVYLAGWVYDESSPPYADVHLHKQYDAIIYIERTTPTRPTAHALDTIAKRARF